MSTNRVTRTYDDALILHEWGTPLTASDYGSDAADAAIGGFHGSRNRRGVPVARLGAGE